MTEMKKPNSERRRVLLFAEKGEALAAEVEKQAEALGWDLRLVRPQAGSNFTASTALESLSAEVAGAAEAMGGLDAAIAIPRRPSWAAFANESHQSFEESLDLGVLLPLAFLQAAAREMAQAGSGGRLIVVADGTAMRGLPGAALRSATQGALLAAMRSLAQEYAAGGITANCVVEGWTETTPGRGPDQPEQNKLLRYIPMKRFGTAADSVGVLRYLVSAESAFMTGQVIAVDGGLLKHL